MLKLQAVNMVKRVCRDCPIPNCGAKYLVKLSNHLTDVHQLDHIQRRKYLQEAKLQPKVKVIIYHDADNTKTSKSCTTSKTSPTQEQQTPDIVYQLSIPRNTTDSLKTRSGGIRKTTKINKPRNRSTHPLSHEWLIMP